MNAYRKERFLRDKETFKGLTIGGKLQFVWDYFKWHIIIGILVIAFIIYVIYAVTRKPADIYIEMEFIGSEGNIEDHTDFINDFANFAGVDSGKIRFIDVSNFSLDNDVNYMDVTYLQLSNRLETGEDDAAICDYAMLKQLAYLGYFSNLDMEQFSELVKKYPDKVITISDGNITLPIAFDVSDSIIIKNAGYSGKVYLAISAKSARISAIEKFLDYIYFD